MSVKIERLETTRLILEPLEARHAEELFEPFSDPGLYAFLDADPPASVDSLKDRYHTLSKRVSGDGKQLWLNWVPRHRATGQAIGYFESSIEGDTAWLAYFVFKAFQQRGHAKEGMAAVRHFIAANYGVKTFVIETDTRNLPSVRLAAALGFRWVATHDKVAVFKGCESHEFRFEYVVDTPLAAPSRFP